MEEREEAGSSSLLLREHLLLSFLSFPIGSPSLSADQQTALTSDGWMHYRGGTHKATKHSDRVAERGPTPPHHRHLQIIKLATPCIVFIDGYVVYI